MSICFILTLPLLYFSPGSTDPNLNNFNPALGGTDNDSQGQM